MSVLKFCGMKNVTITTDMSFKTANNIDCKKMVIIQFRMLLDLLCFPTYSFTKMISGFLRSIHVCTGTCTT